MIIFVIFGKTVFPIINIIPEVQHESHKKENVLISLDITNNLTMEDLNINISTIIFLPQHPHFGIFCTG